VKRSLRKLLAPAVVAALVAPSFAAQADGEVNVYSARQEVLIRPLLDRFTEETGIEVNLLSAGAGELLNRLVNEGRNTPADIFLTVDAGRLHRAVDAGVFQPISSDVLNEHVPAQYRDPEGRWYGLSLRSRVIFRAADRVPEGAIATYEDLADDRWDNRVCIRSSSNIYNQSLVASMIAHHGVEETEQWAAALVDNMARPPQGGDTDQLRAVAAGECDIAVANTYYYGRLLTGDAEDRAIAEELALVWPNQDGRGAHMNVSGAGVTTHAPNRENAIRLLEFLVSEEAQRWYAQVNNEFPVREGVEASPVLQKWGEFKADDLNLAKLGALNDEAVRLMDRAGWR
jgi:iron(III) transport system substrate-binding protein